ncbi:SPRY domain-containing protein 3-like [Oratosquilla oratoria]|uniref:SPRY domain-containing protein 3-like n=1 Tax=Oratosquilla oratoria TaxID=337810 RepID=UPI003F7729EA
MLSCVHPNLFVLFKKLFGSAPPADTDTDSAMYNNVAHEFPFFQNKRAPVPGKVRAERITIEGDVLSYTEEDDERVGVYISDTPVTADHNYFEVEILDMAAQGAISIGLCCQKYPLYKLPGWAAESVGYHADDGKLFKARPRGIVFGPKCGGGDRMGCGVKFDPLSPEDDPSVIPVFFTKNGREIGTVLMSAPAGGLFPCVGLAATGDEVRLTTHLSWQHDEDTHMSIDSNEDEWLRLHDIRLNGQMLEYCGRGKSLIDVGLAQARVPLNTTSHYFEMEIVDPGRSGYITIGLTRKDYPKHRHPGWNRGSIAYHADDGRIFVGSTVGSPFGPRCHKGDVMGCGIIFPRDYVCTYDSDGGSNEEVSPLSGEGDDYLEHLLHVAQYPANFHIGQYPGGGFGDDNHFHGYPGFESDEDDLLPAREHIKEGALVQVFFTRNGKMIGLREVHLPPGGFFPSVSMASLDERVRVDLRPLTG